MKVRAPEPSGTLGVRSLSGAQAAALMNCCDSWVRTILNDGWVGFKRFSVVKRSVPTTKAPSVSIFSIPTTRKSEAWANL